MKEAMWKKICGRSCVEETNWETLCGRNYETKAIAM